MKITIRVPGWLQRRLIARAIEKEPYILSGSTIRRETSYGPHAFYRHEKIGAGIRDFIANEMEERGCDALTAVRTAKRFPATRVTVNFGFGWQE